MFGKMKKVFFTGVFGVLYLSYVAQFAFVLIYLHDQIDTMMVGLAVLSVEWLVLIAARYLSKRSSGNAQNHGGGFRRR